MKYFKHMSIMSEDRRIKRIKKKYGLKGYGLYVLILEYISKQLDKFSPLPDLEENAEDIADEWNCDIRSVNEMMVDMVNEGLFDTDYITGRLVCTKIEKYLDEYIRKVPEIHEAIEDYKTKQLEQFGTTPTNSDNVRECQESIELSTTRIEENRIEEKRREYAPKVYLSEEEYQDLCLQYPKKVIDDYIERVSDYVLAKGKKYKNYKSTIRNWLKKDGVEKIEKKEKKKCPHCGSTRVHPDGFCLECGGDVK